MKYGNINSPKVLLMMQSIKIENKITQLVINTFMGLIAIISAINIFNVVSSSIILRKRDFAVLKSMGMNNKQTNKMLLIEGIFYGLDSLFFRNRN